MKVIEIYKNYLDDDTIKLVAKTLLLFDSNIIYNDAREKMYPVWVNREYRFTLCYIIALLIGNSSLKSQLEKDGYSLRSLSNYYNIEALINFNEDFDNNSNDYTYIENIYETSSRESKKNLIKSINAYKDRQIKYSPATLFVANIHGTVGWNIDILLKRNNNQNTYKSLLETDTCANIIANDYELLCLHGDHISFINKKLLEVDIDKLIKKFYSQIENGNIIESLYERIFTDSEIKEELEFIKKYSFEEYIKYKQQKQSASRLVKKPKKDNKDNN